jgi:ribulose bisphosphate carboxylase small subunit
MTLKIHIENYCMSSASKPRARLSEAQVIAIFQARASASSSTKVAMVYGVSEKAVRDIWKGRTWSKETWHLDPSRPLQLKLTGRPKGCKDSQPRKKRANSHNNELSTSTAQTPCRQHDRHGVAGHAFEQGTFQMPPSQQANQWVWLTQGTDSAAYFEDSSGLHQDSWRTSSTLDSTSVNEQLHEWDKFWRTSTSCDPFGDD